MTKSVVEGVYRQLTKVLGTSEAAAVLRELEPVFLALARNDRYIEQNNLPVVAIVLGVLVLDEHITLLVLAGIALILFGIALSRQQP